MILSAAEYNAALPGVVEAFFLLDGMSRDEERAALVQPQYNPSATPVQPFSPARPVRVPAAPLVAPKHPVLPLPRPSLDPPQGMKAMEGKPNSHINVGSAHAAFLQTYGLTSDEVPLLKLDATNWAAPFSVL